MPGPSFDIAVVGAGVFGAWTARHLVAAGLRVALLDAYGPAHNRASSGGETRIIRAGYGTKEIYTRWSIEAFKAYEAFFAPREPGLLQKTGFLWLGRPDDAYMQATLEAFRRHDVHHTVLSRQDLLDRYPQINLEQITWGILETNAGGLLARRGVQTVVHDTVTKGLKYVQAQVEAPTQRPAELRLSSGATLEAKTFVFACGPWLPKLFPQILHGRIRPTRQEVFYFGVPPGSDEFRAPKLPAWVDPGDLCYGLPDIESRGFKIAPDVHGEEVDPDTQERIVPASSVAKVRAYLARRFPKLAQAPCTQTEVCQYENTVNGDYLIDRHPEWDNVWLVGGGSGHAYKHGPASGRYIADLIRNNRVPDPLFRLSNKALYDPSTRKSTIPDKGQE